MRDDQLRDLSMETSENAQKAKFALTEFCELRVPIQLVTVTVTLGRR